MVTQSAISFKIDSDLLDRLDVICDNTGFKRNKVLNCCIRFAIDTAELHYSIKKVYTFINNIVKND